MRLVIIESPYKAKTKTVLDWHLRYLRAAMRGCLLRGESPYASHGLLTQHAVLRDSVPKECSLGIAAGLEWGRKADATIVYTDLGISDGMMEGVISAESCGRIVEYRQLGGEWEQA